MPRSLYGRFLMIIILPIILSQAIAVYMFYERHWDSINRNMSASLVGEIAMVYHMLIEDKEYEYEDTLTFVRKHLGLQAYYFKTNNPLKSHIYSAEEIYPLLKDSLAHELKAPFSMGMVFEDAQDLDRGGSLEISIPVEGGLLYIYPSNKRLANPSTYIFIMWMVGSTLFLLIVSILFLKNQVRSIVRLTGAAEKFGKGHDAPDFKPQGAREIRQAAISFIQMRERIKRLLTRRTQMLAGVSHDLRTPLTRMKLQLELVEQNDATKNMQDDINEMEDMLEDYLDFARGETKERTEDIDLQKFISEIILGYGQQEGNIKLDVSGDVHIHGKPQAIRRCFTNLIDNAIRYADNVEVSVVSNGRNASIYIEDDGSGIAEDKRKDVFQPFYRIEESRNKETGGTGLGLSITRDIINGHGGKIWLSDSLLGGLKVEISLPL